MGSGAVAMANIERAWRQSGPALECRFSGKGEGQGVTCYSHGWHGVYRDLDYRLGRERPRCPVYGIAAWLFRRAAYYGLSTPDDKDEQS